MHRLASFRIIIFVSPSSGIISKESWERPAGKNSRDKTAGEGNQERTTMTETIGRPEHDKRGQLWQVTGKQDNNGRTAVTVQTGEYIRNRTVGTGQHGQVNLTHLPG
jgi:hypothetical protein